MSITLCPTCELPVGIGQGSVVPLDPQDHSRGWTLLDADGAPLLIGDHGCIAPTKADAVLEGRERHARGDL